MTEIGGRCSEYPRRWTGQGRAMEASFDVVSRRVAVGFVLCGLVLASACGGDDAPPETTPAPRTALFPDNGPWPQPVTWEDTGEVVAGPVRFDTTMTNVNGDQLSITIECDFGEELWMMGELKSMYVCFDEDDAP